MRGTFSDPPSFEDWKQAAPAIVTARHVSDRQWQNLICMFLTQGYNDMRRMPQHHPEEYAEEDAFFYMP